MSQPPLEFSYPATLEKPALATQFKSDIEKLGFTIVEADFNRPWGGFFRLDDTQAPEFITRYFEGVALPAFAQAAPMSPKFLVVEPEMKLSWQVHERRSEFWRVLHGPVAAYLSPTDDQPAAPQIFQAGQTITIPVGTRHRLVGLEGRGIVTEIWVHTDPTHHSDESDIRRIADDFGR